jgi:hypothetical protein
MEKKSISAKIHQPDMAPPPTTENYQPEIVGYQQVERASSGRGPLVAGMQLLVVFVGIIACVLFPPLLIILIPALIISYFKR